LVKSEGEGAVWCGLRWLGERGLSVFGGGVVAGDGEESVGEEGGEVVCHCRFGLVFWVCVSGFGFGVVE
jgi:hypothetical protein